MFEVEVYVDVDLKKNTGTAQLDLEDKALGVLDEVRLAANHAARNRTSGPTN